LQEDRERSDDHDKTMSEKFGRAEQAAPGLLPVRNILKASM